MIDNAWKNVYNKVYKSDIFYRNITNGGNEMKK